MKLSLGFGVIVFTAVLIAVPVLATNGMNMIGFDAVSAAMGGADAATDTGVISLSCNPANLSSVEDKELAVNLSLLMPVVNFKNSTMFGTNDVDGEDAFFPLPFLGYASRVGETPFVWGLGMFAQGGMGVDFKDVKTNFGNEDRIYSNVAYGKLVPAVSWEINENFVVGASFQLGYSTMEYEFFPETSYYDPGPDQTPQTADDMVFPGQKLDNISSLGFSGRVGFRVNIADVVTLGCSYTTASDLNYEDGDLVMNFESMGLGKVKYDAEVDGFTWPAALDMGLSHLFMNDKLLIATDVTWYNWSDAMETVTVKGKDPSSPYAPPEVEVPFAFNWDDQWVWGIGAAYSVTEKDTIRVGYNYGNNPVPDDNLYPLFPAIIEHHVILGYGHEFENIGVNFAWEHGMENSAKNTNTDMMSNPFGPDSESSHYQNTLHMTLVYKF